MVRRREVYKSWSEFVARARAIKTSGRTRTTWANNDPSRVEKSGTFDEALTLALEGWKEGVARIAPLSARLSNHVASTMEAIDWNHDVEAGNLDIARYIDGEPECWLTPSVSHIAAQGRLLTLVFNGTVAWGFDADEIFRRGSAVVALVDCLERAGHSVHLVWALSTASRSRDTVEVLVTVKDFGEPLHLGRVAFALAHGGMLRRLGFAVMEQMPEDIRRKWRMYEDEGHGSPAPISSESQGDVNISEMKIGTTPEDLEGWVKEQLQVQGVTLHEEGRP